MAEDTRWLKSTVNDLNNLLQEISGYVHLARQSSKGENQTSEHLQSCLSSVDRASGTVRSILQHLDGLPQKPEPLPLAPPAPAKRMKSDGSLGFKGLKSQTIETVDGVPITNPTGSKELIMIVDDEVNVLRLAKMMLAESDYRVVTAKDGLEAIDAYKKLGPKINLVILDFTMPGMHGDQVFEELRKLNPSMAVILSSGFADQTKLDRMFAQGLKEFVPKPYTQQHLLSEIRNVLDAL